MVYFSAFIRCQDGDHNHLRTKHQVSTNYVFEAFQDCVGAPGGWARNVPRRISCAAAAGGGAVVGLKGYPPIPPRLGPSLVTFQDRASGSCRLLRRLFNL